MERFSKDGEVMKYKEMLYVLNEPDTFANREYYNSYLDTTDDGTPEEREANKIRL